MNILLVPHTVAEVQESMPIGIESLSNVDLMAPRKVALRVCRASFVKIFIRLPFSYSDIDPVELVLSSLELEDVEESSAGSMSAALT